eukprot:maker-scaffold246_size239296-snap-gene-1.27 protein:Tk01930 transcript:maker-scaffold246_size239296-snap-gene-1.27-mRNA-1 annotation:"thap domain-containing protein 4"
MFEWRSSRWKLKRDALPTRFPHYTADEPMVPVTSGTEGSAPSHSVVRAIGLDHAFARSPKAEPIRTQPGDQDAPILSETRPEVAMHTTPQNVALLEKSRIANQVPWAIQTEEIETSNQVVWEIETRLNRQIANTRHIQEKLNNQISRNRWLELQLKKEQRKVAAQEKKSRKSPFKLDFLNPDQLKYLIKGSHRGFAWGPATIKKGLRLRVSCGTAGYESLLKEGFPLPSMRSLRRFTEGLNFESDLIAEVFNIPTTNVTLKAGQMEEQTPLPPNLPNP